MSESVSVGKVAADGAPFNGWFVGAFTRWFAERGLSSSELAADAPEREVRLGEQGDYVVWGPAVEHRWYAVRDSIILTVRRAVPA